MAAELGSVDEVVERLVRSRLAGEDEIVAGVRHHLGDGVAGEQIVAQKHGAQRREPCAMLVEPALDGVAFAVLLLGAVLGRDEFRHQRHDLGMAGRHDRRRQHRMIALGLAVGALARQTVRATELLRAEELRSVPGDQGPSAQPAEGLPHRRLAKQRLHAFETRLQQRGVRLVQKVADVIVGGNPADAEQRLAVGAAVAFLHRALIGQKRRALHEEHRERRKTEIGGRDVAAPPLAWVAESRADVRAIRREGMPRVASQP